MTATEGENPLWDSGWYRFARQLKSPNYGPRPLNAVVDLIVVHSISLPPGCYTANNVQRLFMNDLDWTEHPYFQSIAGLEVSAHFYIRRTGELWQFVSIADRAWHAGKSSYRGRTNCNDDSIGIELEGIEGSGFEDAQYESLASLSAALCDINPIRYLAGHEHIAPGRKRDPGDGFDWEAVKRSLSLPNQYFP